MIRTSKNIMWQFLEYLVEIISHFFICIINHIEVVAGSCVAFSLAVASPPLDWNDFWFKVFTGLATAFIITIFKVLFPNEPRRMIGKIKVLFWNIQIWIDIKRNKNKDK